VATVQEGVAVAAANDTVYVYSGTYHENVSIDHTLSLIGEYKQTTIIDGGGVDDVVHVTADWVTINELTIRNSGTTTAENHWDAGIALDHCDNTEVASCILRDNAAGLCLYGSSHNSIVSSFFHFNFGGIVFSEDPLVIEGDNYNNTIAYNMITHNINVGIDFEHTLDTYHYSCTIQGNAISHNYTGIYMIMSQENEVFLNAIAENTGYGVVLSACMAGGQHNTVHHNQFVSNKGGSVQAADYSGVVYTNYWYSAIDEEGNYWSDYTGPDSDGDGIGDIPYDIDYGDSQDLYPLMELSLCGNGTCGSGEDACNCWEDCGATCHEPAQDTDGDGQVSLSDYARFVACVMGPGQPWSPAPVDQEACVCLDDDSDCDMDLADFAAFQRAFTGSPP
jgi:nitrous oxidase accessory protein